MSDWIKPPGDRKVARMARKRKRCVGPFPTFCAEIQTFRCAAPRRTPGPTCPNARPRLTGPRYSRGRRVNCGLDDARDSAFERRSLALQLALERFDLFGQRDILGHQRLDLAHGVQDRGVIAASEPAADFGQ